MPFTRLRQSLIQPNGSITGSLLGTASYAITSSYAMNGGSGGGSTPVVSVASLNNQTILYNFSSSQEATITGLTLTNNNWGINVVEEWNSGSGDIYFNSCSLLCHFDSINSAGRFIDNSSNNFTITSSGGAGLSTSQYKFGGASAYFDGIADSLFINYNSALNLSSDFTIELWFYPITSSIGNILNFAGLASVSYASYGIINNTDGINFAASSANTSYDIGSETGATGRIGTVSLNTWNHIAVTRQGNVYRGFVNGVQGYTQTLSLTPYNPNARGLAIGSTCTGSWGVTPLNSINGYLDELRITKGIARYTGSFTTQSLAFPNSTTQTATKYIGLVGGLNDTNVDYGVEKLSDSSLKIKKLTDTQQPSGSFLSASVDRVYVNVLNYSNISVGSTLLGQAFTAVGSTSSYALSRSVVNPYEIVVAVDGAVQSFNNAYSVTSSTINFTENIPSGSLVDIRYLTTPNVNSASYALTSSYALNGGSGGGTGSTVIVYDVLLNNLYDNVLLTYERKPEQLISITSDDYGTQADGTITISTAKNISTDTIASGRTVADGVAYLVTAITSSSSTSNITVSGSSVTGVAVGDEMLLINVQGDTTNYNNVGNYEFLRVSNISTNVISFNAPVSKSYGTTDNSAIGNQKVILQRVPNYSTVTITSVGSLTANSWDGSLGGIVAFKCDTLINSGSINTDGKGFRFGVGGIRDTGAGCTEYPTPAPAGNRAESYRGLNSVAFCSRLGTSTVSSIGGGGGGGAGVSSTSNRSGGGGGGGANRTNGSNGSNASSGNLGASGGTLYNNGTTLLMFGGGGGGGGRAINGIGGNGGSGGGIVLIYANNFSNAAIINSTGSRGVNGTTTDDGGGGGGGGAGGVVFVKSNYVNSVGTLSIAAGGSSSGGVGSLYGTGGAGGAGGLGNQLLKYSVANVSVASVTASFESSSLVTTTAVDPNIEDGFVDNYYVYNTVATVVSASWDSLNKAYYNTTGSVNSLTSYPIRTISSSVVYPSVVRALIFAENNDDDPWVINQDLKFYLSNNGGVSYTTASLVKRGLYETGKFVYSNDINLTSQNTASLTYRLELSSSKVINVYGTGLVWPIDLTVISSSYTAATASFAVTSSFALTSSYAMNGGGGGTTLTTGSTYPITSSWSNNAITASYALNAGSGGGGGAIQTGSIAGQTILYNFSSSQESTLTGLNLTGNKWGVNVIEEWNSGSGDIYFNSCSLLLHFDSLNSSGSFIDNSSNNFAITSSGDAKLSTSQYKFGGASAYFDGTNDYLLIPDNNAFELGSSDFTLESFVYFVTLPSSNGYYSTIISKWASSNNSYFIYLYNAAGTYQLYLTYSTNGTSNTNLGVNWTPNIGQWYHIACVRSSTNVYFWVNGVQQGATQSISGTLYNGTAPLEIGTNLQGSANTVLNGYLDELRITKGVARYTSNFTPQSFAFPNSAAQIATKYIGLVGGLNDTNVDYGIEKLSDTSLKIKKLTDTQQPSGSFLSSSVDRVYVNVLNYDSVSISGSISNAVTASFAQTTPSGKSIALSFILG